MSRTLELDGVREIARGTIELSFKRPGGLVHLAGQNMNLKVPELHYPDPKGPRRTFTIASAPHEPRLLFATRVSESGYKRTLLELEPGALFEFLGPNGQFLYDASIPSTAYLAGGIGITPFRSMLLHAVHTGMINPITLFYSNAAPENTAYHDLFTTLAVREENFTYLPTMTNLTPDDPWPGERGFIRADWIADALPQFAETVFFLCGPPAFVGALTGQLTARGLDAGQIRSESLYGY
ncbi:MAG TPA: FAD-dependent oxidoreductase [bacterium]|nr:FAD-dependent oxidoreductase [bacterium]HQG45360.1 FAD-dependent oxidoreductase [bacterium]HQI50252.1 FAD-dependent oxidoreductase [bacterium]HQJ63417.1 FAD-dependent oxidoreductase [bacterium]